MATLHSITYLAVLMPQRTNYKTVIYDLIMAYHMHVRDAPVQLLYDAIMVCEYCMYSK